MSAIEETIRKRAYELWDHAGRPDDRTDEFWYAARAQFKDQGEETADDEQAGAVVSPPDEPPAVAAQPSVAVGKPGERLVERGVIDDRLDEMLASRPAKASRREASPTARAAGAKRKRS
jgi:hypothetical protein